MTARSKRSMTRPRSALFSVPAAQWLLGASLLTAALWIGGLFTNGLAVAGTLATASFIAAARKDPDWRPRPGASVVVLVAVLGLGYTALQLLPLPPAILRIWAPDTLAIYEDALRPFGMPNAGFHPISLDPPSTRVALAQGGYLLVVFLTALRLADSRESVFGLERMILLLTLTMGAAALLHPAFGLTKVFGVYAPEMAKGGHTAPLLNSNHLAAYLGAGAIFAFGVAISGHPSVPRPIAGAVALLLIAATVGTGSRGGVGALAAGLLLLPTLAYFRKRRMGTLSELAFPLLATGFVVAMVALAATDHAVDELADTDTSKVGLAKRALAFGWKQRWVGVGRGAFEPAFAGVEGTRDNYVFTHPESFPAQFLSEWGLPFSMVLCASIAWALRPKHLFERSHLPAGAYAVLVATTIHEVVDFSTEVPGIAALYAVCTALVLGGKAATTTRLAGFAQRVGTGRGVYVTAGGAFLLFALAFGFQRTERAAEIAHFRQEAERVSRGEAPGAPVLLELQRAMQRHPAESYFPLLGGAIAASEKDPRAIAFVDRALARNAHLGRAHLILARWFYERNPSQARLEYRFAFAEDATTFPSVAREAPNLVGNFDHAMELLPKDLSETEKRGTRMLEVLSAAIGARLPATKARLDAELRLRLPNQTDLVAARANEILHDLREPEPWCVGPDQRAACINEGAEIAQRLESLEPRQCRSHATVAAFEVARKNPHALENLAGHVELTEDPATCLRALADGYADAEDDVHLQEVADRLARLGCSQTEECVANLLHASATERRRHHVVRALGFAKQAFDRAPEREDILELWARLAEEAGSWGEAAVLWERLAGRHPGGPFAERAAQARKQLGESTLPMVH